MKIKILHIKDREFKKEREKLVRRNITYGRAVEGAVKKIVEDVRKAGDKALLMYTRKFDDPEASSIVTSKEDIQEAYRRVQKDDIKSLKYAARRIKDFHRHQKNRSWVYKEGGVLLGQMVTPIERAGVYIPGGKAVYPSTVLMSVIPARIAGVGEIILCTPPGADGINPYTLVAADIAGVDRIYRVGGAQAIGAMAYGTDLIPRVDKIVGPGNIYVTVAKRLLYGQVDIDMVAGPSEILIIADESAEPSLVAMDLLAQAEHDEEAVSILITPSRILAEKVVARMGDFVRTLLRKKIINLSLRRHGLVIVTNTMEEAISLSNEIAPEHLSIQVLRPKDILKNIKNAGAIFLGKYTPQAIGDYVAGPNHTLPTGGTARFFSPLSVDDFMKKSSIIMYAKKSLEEDGPVASHLASIEGLDAHKRSVDIRIGSGGSKDG